MFFSKLSSDSYRVVFRDCKAYNIAKSSNFNGGVIDLQASSAVNTLGGFDFGDFYMEYSRDVPFMKILAPNTSGFQVKDIKGVFRIKELYNNELNYAGSYDPINNVNVNISYEHID